MNKLANTRCYLCGPMDFTSDNGEGWRKQIRSDLSDLNITWLDPTRKPTTRAIENDESRKFLAENKAAGRYDLVVSQMKIIRSIDLRLTDMADFLVVHLDTRIYSFGTIEELSNANRQKKPIIVHCEQGKTGTPNWIFGMIPHHTIFSTWDELYLYLRGIDKSEMIDDPRWQFFNLEDGPIMFEQREAWDDDLDDLDDLEDFYRDMDGEVDEEDIEDDFDYLDYDEEYW